MQVSFVKLSVNADRLKVEILQWEVNENIDALLQNIELNAPDNLVLTFDSELTAEQVISLQIVIDAHVSQTPTEYISKKMQRCVDFGTQLIIEGAAENIVLGITVDHQTGIVLDKLQPVLSALLTGSLIEAITRINAIAPDQYDDKYITAARIEEFVGKITTFLNS